MESKHKFIWEVFLLVFVFIFAFLFAIRGSFNMTAYVVGDFLVEKTGVLVTLIVLKVLMFITFLMVRARLKKK